jgi:hypothetical protein
LTGPGTVHFRNMRVVQYPDTPTPAAAMFSEGQKLMDLTSQNATGNVESVDGNATVVKTTSGGTLWSISYPPVTTSFAILGEVRCEGVGDSYLEVGRGWTPVNEPDRFSLLAVVRADQAQGPFGRLTGTSDWKPFWLPCGAVGIDPVLASAPLKLKVVTVQLHLNGKGAVFLRNVKLVQCPEGFPQSWTPPGTILPDPAVQYPSPPPGGASASITSRAFDWGAFSLGVLSTLLFIVFAILLSFFLKRLQRIRHERELRRIASQDS